jgi:Tol biopolymer transport system component
MLSPNGDKFIFLHRYFVKGVKYDRLLLSNTDGSQVKVLSDHQMISHCFWKNDNTIISFMRRFDYGDKYFEIDISSGKIMPIGIDIIDKFGDGHPNYYRNQMLFDTYPNKARMKELFMYNFENHNLSKVGEFFESFKYEYETRCDLHQRWSMDGKYIFFDSVHTGVRKLYYMKVNK